MIIPTHQRRTATKPSRNIHHRFVDQTDPRRKQQHAPALAVTALAVDQSGTEQRALARLDINFTAAAAAGEDLAGDIDGDIGERCKLRLTAGTIGPGDVDRALHGNRALICSDAHSSTCSAARLRRTGRIQRHALDALHRNCASAQSAARAQLPGADHRRRRRIHCDLTGRATCRLGCYRRGYVDRTRVRAQRHAAACAAVGAQARRGLYRDRHRRSNADRPALALGADGFDHAGDGRAACFRLNRDLPTLRPRRLSLASSRQRDVLLRLEEDLAVLAHHRAVRRDQAALLDRAGEDADAAGLGDHLADVDGGVLGRGQEHAQFGLLRIDQFHALAGGEDDLALGAGDNAVVLDVGRDEVDEAAARRGDGAVIDDLARAADILQLELAGERVAVTEAQAGGDETGGVDARAGADGDAVGVDEVDAAVGLQLPQDRRLFRAGDAVQHCALRVLLDEAGELVGFDREPLPVDDGPGGVGDAEAFAAGGEGRRAADDGRIGRVGLGIAGKTRGHCDKQGLAPE